MTAMQVPPVGLARPSPLLAFRELVLLTLRRQWRVRQLGVVALGLLALLTVVVAVMSYGPAGWGLGNRFSFFWQRRVERIPILMDTAVMTPMPAGQAGLVMALVAPLRAVLLDPAFTRDWAFLNFSRWVVFTMHLGFYLPLVTLAYASGAIGDERENRTLIWLTTRPLPRWAIFLAKYLGALPWCLAASVGGFGVLSLAGGELGARAFAAYWPGVLGATVAFSALFHFLGTVARRPAVLGLVYVFFFETLVANLPGSLKQLSINYYARSLFYDEARTQVASLEPANLGVYAPAEPAWAFGVLLVVTLGFLGLGAACFARQEAGVGD